jgi:hypothetical protein
VEHVVFYPGTDGSGAFSRAADLDEAVRLVEHLRNDNGIGDVSVFALHPVPLAFRTYVHVELPVAVDEAVVDEPVVEESHVEEPAAGAELPAIPPPPPTPPSGERDSEISAEVEVEIVAEVPDEAEAEWVEPLPELEVADWAELAELAELVESSVPEDEAPVAEQSVAEQSVAEQSVADLPTLPEPASDFFEPIEDFQPEAAPDEAEPVPYEIEVPEAEIAEPELEYPELVELVAEFVEPEAYFVEPEAEFVEAEFVEPELPAAEVEALEVEATEVEATEVEATEVETAEPAILPEGDIVMKPYEHSPSELPPLTLAPGPLLFDGDDQPIVGSGSYDRVEEAPAELTALIPADFTDLIPKDIPHGDLARHVDGEAAAPEPVAEELPAPPVSPVFDGEPAPSTEDLPPMDVAEIPADVSSIETLAGTPIPTARANTEEPVTTPREGPRGLGFFGG